MENFKNAIQSLTTPATCNLDSLALLERDENN